MKLKNTASRKKSADGGIIQIRNQEFWPCGRGFRFIWVYWGLDGFIGVWMGRTLPRCHTFLSCVGKRVLA